MKAQLVSLTQDSEDSVDLPDDIFGLDPRSDILHRVVRWQRAKARQGTHKAKTRSETSYSKRKIYSQKKTGNARHGDRNAPIFRKGGAYKAPHPRDHSHKLPKKVRRLGLLHALSAKAAESEVVVLDAARMDSPKTKDLAKAVSQFGWRKVLVIDGPTVDENFARAAANLPGMDILPCQGANVFDILKCRELVITKSGLEGLAARLA